IMLKSTPWDIAIHTKNPAIRPRIGPLQRKWTQLERSRSLPAKLADSGGIDILAELAPAYDVRRIHIDILLAVVLNPHVLNKIRDPLLIVVDRQSPTIP